MTDQYQSFVIRKESCRVGLITQGTTREQEAGRWQPWLLGGARVPISISRVENLIPLRLQQRPAWHFRTDLRHNQQHPPSPPLSSLYSHFYFPKSLTRRQISTLPRATAIVGLYLVMVDFTASPWSKDLCSKAKLQRAQWGWQSMGLRQWA